MPGGLVSNAIVNETRPADRWRLSSPHGGLQVDRDGADILMVAGSTGLAPLRALIMDLSRFRGEPPSAPVLRRTLSLRALSACHVVADRFSHNPWLSVSPVSEYNRDPAWAAEYPDVTPPRGLHVHQTGRLPEVVTKYGGWGDEQDAGLRRTRSWSAPPGTP